MQEIGVKDSWSSSRLRVNREAVRVRQNDTRKAKAHLKLNLAKHVKENKIKFFKYINNKRKIRIMWPCG